MTYPPIQDTTNDITQLCGWNLGAAGPVIIGKKVFSLHRMMGSGNQGGSNWDPNMDNPPSQLVMMVSNDCGSTWHENKGPDNGYSDWAGGEGQFATGVYYKSGKFYITYTSNDYVSYTSFWPWLKL